MKFRMLWLATIACLLFATMSLAASTFKLKDGRILVGDFKKLGNSYSILMDNGTRTVVPASDIVEIDGKPVVTDAKTTAAEESSGVTTNEGLIFKSTKAKADKVDAAVIAVQLWDDFISKYPNSPDIEAAKKEKEAWNKLYKDNAEKVKTKWVGGQELKDIKKKCDELYEQAIDHSMEAGVRGVGGMKKLDEILDLYPNHFGANYEKGFYLLTIATRTKTGSAENLSKGVKALEHTTELAPTVPEVWSNLAIGYNFQKKYQLSIESAWRAVTMRDDDLELIKALAQALYNAPKSIIDVNKKVREINEQAQVIFRKHGVPGVGGDWTYLRPRSGGPSDRPPEDKSNAPGVQWSGSGFFVTDDGYLITNHHVAAMDPHAPEVPKGITFRVRMDDGTELPADFVAMDDKADIAIMKIKAPKPTSFLKIAPDNPGQGAEALVLGYPATGGDFNDHTLQVSKGTVKSINITDEYHVWLDLNTTHGNSGGPIVDKHGNVIAILTAHKEAYNMQIVLGVGVKQIGDFLSRLADKAPKVATAQVPDDEPSFLLDSEKLTKQCRNATVLVLAVRGAEAGETGGAAPSDGGGPAGTDPPAAGGGESPAPSPTAPTPGGGGGGGGGGGSGPRRGHT